MTALNQHSGVWTDERVATLKKLWAEGVIASTIARQMGGFSRSAIIGKANRLGLAGRKSGATRPRSAFVNQTKTRRHKEVIDFLDASARLKDDLRDKRRRRRPRGMKLAGNATVRALFANAEPVPAIEELVIPLNERKTIISLDSDKQCAWPIGDPQHADFHLCGKAKVSGLSYCEHHARRAYEPPVPRSAPEQHPPTPAFILEPT